MKSKTKQTRLAVTISKAEIAEYKHKIEWVETASRRVLPEAVAIGEWLIRCNTKLKHGQWMPWCKRNFPERDQSNLQKYMLLGQHRNFLEHQRPRSYDVQLNYSDGGSQSTPSAHPLEGRTIIEALQAIRKKIGQRQDQPAAREVQTEAVSHKDNGAPPDLDEAQAVAIGNTSGLYNPEADVEEIVMPTAETSAVPTQALRRQFME